MALPSEKAHAGVITCFTCISSEGMDQEEDKMCGGIARRVWEATGFRFTYDLFLFEFEGQLLMFPHSIRYKTKRIQKNGTVERVYKCCQSAASQNNCQKKPKMDPEQEKKGRDTRRMSCFPCNRLLYVTVHNGNIECQLKHSLDHICYTDIRIPDNWWQYITENHRIGPANVSDPLLR